ncbi:hypothetical protein CLOM_g14579 [Closterium sp. NIES-68]|nr:hypothetical protein CLOM_g14579 [Closterium sp. NIES-68]
MNRDGCHRCLRKTRPCTWWLEEQVFQDLYVPRWVHHLQHSLHHPHHRLKHPAVKQAVRQYLFLSAVRAPRLFP